MPPACLTIDFCLFIGTIVQGWFSMSETLFSSQKSVAERTNVKSVKLFCKWPLQSAELTISHLSPLSIDLSAAWLHSALLHAPFLIVSISCDSSSASSFSIKCDVKQPWTSGAAAVLNTPPVSTGAWRLSPTQTCTVNVAVSMALLVTKRERNYSNEAYAGLGIIRGG